MAVSILTASRMMARPTPNSAAISPLGGQPVPDLQALLGDLREHELGDRLVAGR
jgi:hypothetical protein